MTVWPSSSSGSWRTTCMPWLCSLGIADFPVYIWNLQAYVVCTSQTAQIFNPYFAGLEGIYCLNEQRPLKGTSCSSVHMSLPGVNSSGRRVLHICSTGPWSGPACLSCSGLSGTVGHRTTRLICKNLFWDIVAAKIARPVSLSHWLTRAVTWTRLPISAAPGRPAAPPHSNLSIHVLTSSPAGWWSAELAAGCPRGKKRSNAVSVLLILASA